MLFPSSPAPYHFIQLERSRRYLQRLRDIYAGVFNDGNTKQTYEDDVLSFFMHCYHVRDWLIHAEVAPVQAKKVDEFISGSSCLKLCADICNGVKHCKLTKPPRSGCQPNFSGKEYKSSLWLSGSSGGELLQARYTIHTATGPVDALDLAENCVQSWSDFIAETCRE